MARKSSINPGDKFGSLSVVIRATERGMWLCVCDCGNEVYRTTASLVNVDGPTCRSCYVRRNDVIGEEFGQFKAVAYEGNDKHGNALWRFACSCDRGVLVLTRQSMAKRKVKMCQFCENDLRTQRINTIQRGTRHDIKS